MKFCLKVKNSTCLLLMLVVYINCNSGWQLFLCRCCLLKCVALFSWKSLSCPLKKIWWIYWFKSWRLKSAMACAIICSAERRRKLLSLEHTKYRWLAFERQPGLITTKDKGQMWNYLTRGSSLPFSMGTVVSLISQVVGIRIWTLL